MSGSPPRETTRTVLGTCPACDARIPIRSLLAQYELADGWPRLLAECPGCEHVVHPG